MSAALQLAIEGSIARITLDRPDLGNPVDVAAGVALGEAADTIAARPDVRAVLLTGKGPMFSVGGDVRAFVAARDEIATLIGDELVHLNETMRKLAALPMPVITALNGPVAGGGIGLALTADVVIAAESARFRAGYAAIGLSPDVGTSFHLTRILGPMRAKEFLFTNRFIDASEALSLGLVLKVVPDDRLDAEATALAERIASFPAGSHAAVKVLVNAAPTLSYDAILDLERTYITRNAATADCREGVAAFIEKRRPAFARIPSSTP